MKAIVSAAPGGPDTLRVAELPEPAASRGELLVRVEACAINYPDALIIEDKYQFRPARPFAPGGEIAGTIEAVGEAVSGWKPGDRIIAATISGGLAQRIVIPASSAFSLPGRHTAAEGAALLMTYATGIHGLIDRGQLQAGETLLVLGAAGGVGMAAIEIGKALGARVIAAVSSAEKAAACRAIGADETLAYERGPFDTAGMKRLGDAFKAAAGPNGVDVVYDPVGGNYSEPALRTLNWGGRYLVIGFTAGIPAIPLNLPLLKGCDIRGVFWGGFVTRMPERNRAHVAQLFQWWADGKLAPKIDRVFPFDDAGDAIAWVSGRHATGKVVVAVDPSGTA
jgi:NADPH:quinone reductase-like Zn-dependent oxidoreductase